MPFRKFPLSQIVLHLLVFGLVSSGIGSELAAQLPENRKTNWSQAGLLFEPPLPGTIINVSAFGAIGDGVNNDAPAVQAAINSASGPSIIWFPSGTYKLDTIIVLKSDLILKGEGVGNTKLWFDHQASSSMGIRVAGIDSLIQTRVLKGNERGSKKLLLQDASRFKKGGWLEMFQENGSWDTQPISWADRSVGQMFEIDSIDGNWVYLKEALRLHYDTSLLLSAKKVDVIENVGIECLEMERLNNDTLCVCFNIGFELAVNSWVRGVESKKSIASHIGVNRSSNLEFRGNYLHHAFQYSGVGTRGYGIVFFNHSVNSLVENNIFRKLRHSMMVKQGSNGNVFAYNYSLDPFRSEFPNDAGADLSCHGHYPFLNLFEGNIGSFVWLDQAWGPSGPFNTFLRNRLNVYGIIISEGTVESDSQNFLGNEITSDGLAKGNYTIEGAGHFEHANNQRGNIIPAGTSLLADSSYYLSEQPAFWSFPGAWPSIGPPNSISAGSIPAKIRYDYGHPLTLCTAADIVHTNIAATVEQDSEVFYIRGNRLHWLSLESGGNHEIKVFNTLGQLVFNKDLFIESGEGNLELSLEGRTNQMYWVQILSERGHYKLAYSPLGNF